MDARTRALELVAEGIVTAEDMLRMALNHLSVDEVDDMLDANELSDRFADDEEPDVDQLTEWLDFDADC